ncbi:DUF3833 domain-containing protein [Actibacterium sp. XHP0104]|uniref:DUF3833 domain-containing protein n=1 Tax=Actibacterium sp. XHP0104 TaxID=2984335 RepID=UPI0021E821AC|nr:DUF3833 domain-containing protein [Actibacterium sp. XHP0104]MCV2882777.1 DUF3833 domain-containing protein [Actibacterium sp. XHP0104]
MKVMTALALIIATVIVTLLALRGLGFAGRDVGQYADTTPRFDVTRHLSGPMLSEGVIFGPTGKVAARFTARMQGDWQGDSGTLHEEFTFASGARQTRTWQLTRHSDGRLTGTAPDVIGTATGETAGAALKLRYRLRLEPDAGGHVLDVTDWLFLNPDGSITNRSEMRKFGVKVAELVASIRPVPAN